MYQERLKDFFQTYAISSSSSIVIACSSGPDSMFLLHEVAKFFPKQKIIVAHFNHCLRAEESDTDEDFLHDFCHENDLLFVSTSLDIKALAESQKKGIEESARIARYSFLEKIRETYGAKYILTAHHLDDSIETLLFNFIRGSKISGLTGIQEQNKYILRPLLQITKQEILSSLEKDNIPYRIDSSNTDTVYLRNHLRVNIIPEFERINPMYRKNLSSFMEYMKELENHLDLEVQAFLEGKKEFSVSRFETLSPFQKREIIRHLYSEANDGTIGLSEGNIAEIIRFISDKGNYTEKTLGKLFLEKKNAVIFISTGPEIYSTQGIS